MHLVAHFETFTTGQEVSRNAVAVRSPVRRRESQQIQLHVWSYWTREGATVSALHLLGRRRGFPPWSRSRGLDRYVSDTVDVDELHFRSKFVELCSITLRHSKFVVRLCVLSRVKKDDLH